MTQILLKTFLFLSLMSSFIFLLKFCDPNFPLPFFFVSYIAIFPCKSPSFYPLSLICLSFAIYFITPTGTCRLMPILPFPISLKGFFTFPCPLRFLLSLWLLSHHPSIGRPHASYCLSQLQSLQHKA